MPNGRFNKRGKELVDLVIDPSEAPIVRMVFDKTVHEGYGSHRMAAMLNSMGINTHNGSEFWSSAVNRILRNRVYCGYYTAGDINRRIFPTFRLLLSPVLEHNSGVFNSFVDSLEK